MPVSAIMSREMSSFSASGRSDGRTMAGISPSERRPSSSPSRRRAGVDMMRRGLFTVSMPVSVSENTMRGLGWSRPSPSARWMARSRADGMREAVQERGGSQLSGSVWRTGSSLAILGAGIVTFRAGRMKPQ